MGNVPNLRFPEFTGEWKKASLQDIATVNPKSVSLQDSFVYIDLEAVEKGELKKIQEIIRKDAPSRAQRVIYKNDILFQCVRPYQRNNYIHKIQDKSNKQWVASTGYAQIRTTETQNYIYHLLNTDGFNRKVMVRCTGSSYPAINSEDLATIRFYLATDTSEQLKISRLFDLLDERIATQNKIIEKLESLIKGIADKLFQTARETKLLLELAPNITSGTDKNGSGTIPLYGSTGIIGKVKNASQKGNIVLVARVGTIGTVQYVKESCGVSDNALIVEAGEMTKYIYHFLKTYKFAHITSGTTQPLITASSLKKIAVPTYDIERQTQIVLCLNILERKLDIEKQYLSDIAMMKQYLLHQMFI